jgi:cytochrome c553
MYWKYALLLAGILCCSLAAATETDTINLCNSCHAAEFQLTSKAPSLAGQQQFYLKKQLRQFQTDERGIEARDPQGQQMAAVAKTLTETETDQLAAYFSGLAASPGVQSGSQHQDPALLDQGRRLYIGSCGACHGNKAQGNTDLKAPALLMLNADYLQLQLQHFQTGLRGNISTDKPGRQMALMSSSLTAEQQRAVAAYIAAGLP